MNNYQTQITRTIVKLGGLATLINFLNPLSTSGAQLNFDVVVKNEKVGSLDISSILNNTRLQSKFLVTKNNWSLTHLKPGTYQLQLAYSPKSETAEVYEVGGSIYGRTLKGVWTGEAITPFV